VGVERGPLSLVSTIERLCGLVVRVRFPALAHFFLEVVGLERGTISLVNTSEELLGRKSRGPGLENREYGHDDARYVRN
jgi:hypothetical protein